METYLAHNTRSQVTGVALDLILSTDWDFGTAVSVTLHKRDAVRGKEKKNLTKYCDTDKGEINWTWECIWYHIFRVYTS